jgi:hypothetical protein
MHIVSYVAWAMNRLWQPNKTKEFWIKIPLGLVKRRVYDYATLGYYVGWHTRYLLATADWRMSRPGWRVQWQVQCRPLAKYEHDTSRHVR